MLANRLGCWCWCCLYPLLFWQWLSCRKNSTITYLTVNTAFQGPWNYFQLLTPQQWLHFMQRQIFLKSTQNSLFYIRHLLLFHVYQFYFLWGLAKCHFQSNLHSFSFSLFLQCILTMVCKSSPFRTLGCTPWSTWPKRKEIHNICKNYSN